MSSKEHANSGNHKLGSVLWNCANTLRGSAVDRTDWKAYILPLLFLKGISDVWDEETEEARALFGEADPVDFPEVHRFVVPEGCHWRDVRETPANVGAALSHAMREIERANPDTLFRVFGTADWVSATRPVRQRNHNRFGLTLRTDEALKGTCFQTHASRPDVGYRA